MTDTTYNALLVLAALGFSVFFAVTVLPAAAADWDIIGAFAAGFVNPFASGYSTDVFVCFAVLAIWVIYERSRFGVKHGWVCLVLSVIPGVAVGFALYLMIRHGQLKTLPRLEEGNE